MKKIIDFFVAAYFSMVYKKLEETTRLENALIVLTIFWGFNGISLFLCSLPLIRSIPLIGNYLKLSSPYAYGVLICVVGILIMYIIKYFLNQYYSEQQSGYIKTYSERFPRVLLILFVITHYLSSVLFACYSLSFMSYLRP